MNTGHPSTHRDTTIGCDAGAGYSQHLHETRGLTGSSQHDFGYRQPVGGNIGNEQHTQHYNSGSQQWNSGDPSNWHLTAGNTGYPQGTHHHNQHVSQPSNYGFPVNRINTARNTEYHRYNPGVSQLNHNFPENLHSSHQDTVGGYSGPFHSTGHYNQGVPQGYYGAAPGNRNTVDWNSGYFPHTLHHNQDFPQHNYGGTHGNRNPTDWNSENFHVTGHSNQGYPQYISVGAPDNRNTEDWNSAPFHSTGHYNQGVPQGYYGAAPGHRNSVAGNSGHQYSISQPYHAIDTEQWSAQSNTDMDTEHWSAQSNTDIDTEHWSAQSNTDMDTEHWSAQSNTDIDTEHWSAQSNTAVNSDAVTGGTTMPHTCPTHLATVTTHLEHMTSLHTGMMSPILTSLCLRHLGTVITHLEHMTSLHTGKFIEKKNSYISAQCVGNTSLEIII
ncbi:hypothetical protein ACOMHN_010207 [Nucella lapillus]